MNINWDFESLIVIFKKKNDNNPVFGAQVLPVKYNKILLKSRKVDTSVHTYLYGPLRNIIKSLKYNLKLS